MSFAPKGMDWLYLAGFFMVVALVGCVSNQGYQDSCVEANARDICSEMGTKYERFQVIGEEVTAVCLKERTYTVEYSFTTDEKQACTAVNAT